jgi:hypothetical protein
MNCSRYLGLLALGGLALATIGSAQAYQGYPRSASNHGTLPPLYVSSDAAQQACPTDKVVWLNWAVPDYHLPTDRWYNHTRAGAFACLGQTTQFGIPQVLRPNAAARSVPRRQPRRLNTLQSDRSRPRGHCHHPRCRPLGDAPPTRRLKAQAEHLVAVGCHPGPPR